jgi:hypothetical protein
MCDIPAPGETVQLVELGSHCRGAVFLDGSQLRTDRLEEAIDRISQAHPGFFLGRFDVRASSWDAFARGQFSVIELNGVSAEATHIYDPKVSLLEAYRVMFKQWKMAFEIGAANRGRGAQPMRFSALFKLLAGRISGFRGTHLTYAWPRPVPEASGEGESATRQTYGYTAESCGSARQRVQELFPS